MVLQSVVALFLATLLTGPMWVLTGSAHACSCLRQSVESRTVSSDAIVLGTVRDITDRSDQGTVISLSYDLTVEVEKYFKGRRACLHHDPR